MPRLECLGRSHARPERLPAEIKWFMAYDQGRETAQHRLITTGTQMQVHDAHPSSLWKSGTNDDTNSLVQFSPERYKLQQSLTPGK